MIRAKFESPEARNFSIGVEIFGLSEIVGRADTA